MQKFNVENHEPSFLPNGKNWKLVWSDEFDGQNLIEAYGIIGCILVEKDTSAG